MRIGRIRIFRDVKIETPNVALIDDERVPSERAELFIKNGVFLDENKKEVQLGSLELDLNSDLNNLYSDLNNTEGNKELYIVKDSLPMAKNPKLFARKILELRKRVGTDPLIYCAGIGRINEIAPLVYCGVDLFDSLQCTIASRNETLMNPSFMDTKETDEKLFKENFDGVKNEIKIVKKAIKMDSLRELAEVRSLYDSSMNVFLREIDDEYSTMEIFSPVKSSAKLKSLSTYSLARPEFKRYRKRICELYRRPESAEVLLLLPCSAKKPYSFSRSHRSFIRSIRNREGVHEVIITSPLALVPRELELFYPCSNYDIPVSGHWYEDEKTMIKNCLNEFLKRNGYKKAIVHFEDPFFLDVLKSHMEYECTCKGKATSPESLENLTKATSKIQVNGKSRSLEDINSISNVQFGVRIFDESCKIRGKYPYQKVNRGGKQMAMLSRRGRCYR
jgi:Queuine tRNA-ribosyltransferases, contain PUA domain